jgi:hypothetical protein
MGGSFEDSRFKIQDSRWEGGRRFKIQDGRAGYSILNLPCRFLLLLEF